MHSLISKYALEGKTDGSPNNFASSSEALYDLIFMVLKISEFNLKASSLSKGNILDCNNECQPKAPKPKPAAGIAAAIKGNAGLISFGIIFLILLRIFLSNPILFLVCDR